MSKFILPKYWCVKDCKKVTDYFNEKFGYEVEEVHRNTYYNQYLNEKEKLDFIWLDKDDIEERGYTIITYKQFEEHVLGIKPEKISRKKEDYSHLKKLLSQI